MLLSKVTRRFAALSAAVKSMKNQIADEALVERDRRVMERAMNGLRLSI